METMDIQRIIKEIKTCDFTLGCQMPMGYAAGFPVLTIKNGSLCMMIPYLKYKATGEVDKTYVYPIRFTITVEIPEKKIVSFEDLSYHPAFAKVDFSKPIGTFRHEAIRKYSKKEYFALRDELFALYGKAASAIRGAGDFGSKDDARMRELLQLLLEPCLRPIYRVLDVDFFRNYLS